MELGVRLLMAVLILRAAEVLEVLPQGVAGDDRNPPLPEVLSHPIRRHVEAFGTIPPLRPGGHDCYRRGKLVHELTEGMSILQHFLFSSLVHAAFPVVAIYDHDDGHAIEARRGEVAC